MHIVRDMCTHTEIFKDRCVMTGGKYSVRGLVYIG